MGDHGTPYSKVSHRCKLLQEWMSDPGRSLERNHIMSSVVCPKGIQERIKKRVDKQIETAIGQMTQIIFGAQWVASSPRILELCLRYVREEVWEWVDKQVELSLWLIMILNINFHRSLISQTLKWLKDINYTPHGKNIMVGTVHRPPYRNFSMFLKKFNDIFSKISKDNKQFYVMGDFNLDPPSIYNHHMPTQEFIVSLFSRAFLPPIFLSNTPDFLLSNTTRQYIHYSSSKRCLQWYYSKLSIRSLSGLCIFSRWTYASDRRKNSF